MVRVQDLIDKKRRTLNIKTKMDLCIEIAIYYSDNRDFNKAFDEYQDLLALAEEENDLPMKIKAYRQMGECMLELQKPLEALDSIKSYLKTSQDLGDLFEIQRAFVTIGRCFLDHAMMVKSPKSKQVSVIKSENAFIKSLQLCNRLFENPTDIARTRKSYRSEVDFNNEVAEMRAVSLFNLGLVNREKSVKNAISESQKYFSQCCAVSLKQRLYEMFLRSMIQRIDLKYIQSVEAAVLADLSTTEGDSRAVMGESVNLVKSGLNQLSDVPFSSGMKKLRREMLEQECQCLVVAGNIRKAAKKYRNLAKRSHINRNDFNKKMICALYLNKILKGCHERKLGLKDQIKIGQIYEELNIPLLALKHYKFAFTELNNNDESELRMKLVNRIIYINEIVGHYQDNISLLEDKMRNIIQGKTTDKYTAQICCCIMKQLLNCWIRCDNVYEHLDRLVLLTDQLDSLAIVTNKLSIQLSSMKVIVDIYEQLSIPSLSDHLIKAREKLERLQVLSSNNDNEELDDDIEEIEEEDLSDLDMSNDELGDELSSDSDVDLRTLTEGQIEELEAVGKRSKPGSTKSFIKRNEKGETLLHVAAINGNLKQVEKLIDKMEHPLDIVDSAGWTPLHDAANHGHTKIVAFLLDRGANIEHTGPPIDCSTALMEAVHGGNIDTAIMLIERGANLWHKNRQKENLGDCIDGWRQRSKDNYAFEEPEARAYQTIMKLIKQKLGDRYIEWCRERRGLSLSEGVNHVPVVSVENKQPDVPKYNRRLLDQEQFLDNKENGACGRNIYVEDYLSTMRSVKGCSISLSSQEKDSTCQISGESGYVIGDDWLEDDLTPLQKKNKPIKEPDYGRFSRGSRKRANALPINSDEIKCKKVLNSSEDNTMTPVKSPISNEMINNEISKNISAEINQSDKMCQSLHDVDNTSDCSEISNPGHIIKKHQSTVVTVVYRSISMVVPLIEGCTVEWLIEETVRRYLLLCPSGGIIDSSNIRISTEAGSFLLPSDPLHHIISDFVGCAPIRLLADDISHVQTAVSSRFKDLHSNIKSSLDVHHLDLSNRNLSKDLPDYLSQLHFTYHLNSLRKISLKDNNITDDIVTKPFNTNLGSLDLARFILHHSSTIEEIDLSGNKITGAGLSSLLHSLQHKSILKLTTLDLSFNPIGANDFCVISLILKPIFSVFPSIRTLKISGCQISNFSEYSSVRSSNNNSHIQLVLSELDLSYNPLIIKHNSCDMYLWKLLESSIQLLSFRGCGTSMANLDNPQYRLVEFIAPIVEIIAQARIKPAILDLSDCSLDLECIHHISRLYISKQSTISFIMVHDNDILRLSASNWCSFLHSLSQPICKITKLAIDMPIVRNYDEFQTCIYTVQEKIRSRIGSPLKGIHLKIRPDMINHIKYALFEHGLSRLSEDSIRLSAETDDLDDEEHQSIHYCKCFILSIVDFFRDRDGNDNIRVEFEESFLKIMNCVDE